MPPSSEVGPSAKEGCQPLLTEEPGTDLQASSEACSFWFLKADFVRSYRHGKQLPFFQEVWKEYPDQLVKIRISYRDVVKGTHVKDKMAVSHRWMEPDSPDADGVQLQAIQAFLRSKEGKQFNYVWVDAPCMPQDIPKGSRTEEDTAQFKQMLPSINMIYLGVSVLILLDLSYQSRFWTQAEAWMSMQFSTPGGLKSSIGTPNERHRVECIHNAVGVAEAQKTSLIQTWAGKTPEQAFKVLSRPDVTVTNLRDKEVLLPKIRKLSDTVQEAFDLVKTDLNGSVADAARALAEAEEDLKKARQEGQRAVEKAIQEAEKATLERQRAVEKAKAEAEKAKSAKEEQEFAIRESVMLPLASLEKVKKDKERAERAAERRRSRKEFGSACVEAGGNCCSSLGKLLAIVLCLANIFVFLAIGMAILNAYVARGGYPWVAGWTALGALYLAFQGLSVGGWSAGSLYRNVCGTIRGLTVQILILGVAGVAQRYLA